MYTPGVFGSQTSQLIKKIYWQHIYATFVNSRHGYGEHECRRLLVFLVFCWVYTLKQHLKVIWPVCQSKQKIVGSHLNLWWKRQNEGVHCHVGLACLELHLSVDFPPFVWTIYFFANDQVWTKVFLKTNDGGYLFVKMPGSMCTRPKKTKSADTAGSRTFVSGASVEWFSTK